MGGGKGVVEDGARERGGEMMEGEGEDAEDWFLLLGCRGYGLLILLILTMGFRFSRL